MARKQRTGVVQSDKMDKTVVVMVERTVTHPLYKKVLRRRKQYQAHDEANSCALGDKVLIEECRPLSKNKHWRVIEILERHEVADIQPRDISAPALEPPTAPDTAAPETDTPDTKALNTTATDNDAPDTTAAEDDPSDTSPTDTGEPA